MVHDAWKRTRLLPKRESVGDSGKKEYMQSKVLNYILPHEQKIDELKGGQNKRHKFKQTVRVCGNYTLLARRLRRRSKLYNPPDRGNGARYGDVI